MINRHFKDSKVSIEYSNDIKDVYPNIDYYSPNEKCKILIVFGCMIADKLSNNKL